LNWGHQKHGCQTYTVDREPQKQISKILSDFRRFKEGRVPLCSEYHSQRGLLKSGLYKVRNKSRWVDFCLSRLAFLFHIFNDYLCRNPRSNTRGQTAFLKTLIANKAWIAFLNICIIIISSEYNIFVDISAFRSP